MGSRELFEKAKTLFPGGVNSPARLLKPYPFYVTRAEGSRVYTVDGGEYIDYCMAFGSLILGHRDEEAVNSVVNQLDQGWLYGIPCELELKLAEKIKEHYPSIELMRFVNSGAEAAMNAVRVARGYTRRRKVIKFEGCYHGSYDSLLVKAGSSAIALGAPSSSGVLEDLAKHTLVARYNDLGSVEKLASEFPGDIAAVIVEPIAANMGLVTPKEGFLEGLRELCDRVGALLIFDEIVTGYRVGLGGAQGLYNVRPDITLLGKVVGGGFPIAVFGGRGDVMSLVSPSGDVHNAGTFNAHPVSLAAGLATINTIEKRNAIAKASGVMEEIHKVVVEVVEARGLDVVVNRSHSMMQVFFTKRGRVETFDDVKACNTRLYSEFHRLLMNEGVYWAPSQFETGFSSASHTRADVDRTVVAVEKAMRGVGGLKA